MAWPVSSDKLKAPLTYATAFSQVRLFLASFWRTFSAIMEAPFRMRSHPSECDNYQKKRKGYQKIRNTLFLVSGFLMTDLYVLLDVQNSWENRSKNKLVCENTVVWAQGSCWLAPMGSWWMIMEIRPGSSLPLANVEVFEMTKFLESWIERAAG